jgi:NTE family protein
MNSKPSIGLGLSGGGVRGISHLGVLKALNEAGIFPNQVSGSSAGAIVGAMYCQGYSPDEVLKIIIETNYTPTSMSRFIQFIFFTIERR